MIAIDTNRRELVAASVLADAFVQVPLARAPEFPAALHDLAAAYPGSCYLPLHDEEIAIASRLAAEGRLPHDLALIAPPYDVVRLCCDKWAMHRWLSANGLPSPETALATPAALEKIQRPAILKPRQGTNSQGVRLIDEATELSGIDASQWLLQDQLRRPEVGLDAFLSRSTGAFHCMCREYLERKGGVAIKVRVHVDPELSKIAERLARELPLRGAFLAQFMRDCAARWQIIDVNPRVGSATRMNAALGLDFAAANLADFWGESTESLLRPLPGAHYVVRQYANYVTCRSP
jgi:biotin carboxylase